MFNSKLALLSVFLGVFTSAVLNAFAHPNPNPNPNLAADIENLAADVENPTADIEKREFSRLFKLTAHNVLNANNTGMDNTPRDIYIASNGGSQEFGWFATYSEIDFTALQLQDGKLIAIKDNKYAGGASDPSVGTGGFPVEWDFNGDISSSPAVYSIVTTPVPTDLLAINGDSQYAWQLCHTTGRANPTDQLVVFNPKAVQSGGPANQPFDFDSCHHVVLQLTYV